MEKDKIIAIITARYGSKRIPKKNIKDFNGKPMIAYAIEAALNSDIFDYVMVSTDSMEIAKIAASYGAEVPFLRSESTSNDTATTREVLDEVVTELKIRGKDYKDLCCIYPCVPFLTPEILKEAYKIFKQSNSDVLMPVIKYSHPIQRALKINSKNLMEYISPDKISLRTQDLEASYHDIGMFYYHKLPFVTTPNICPYIMQEKAVQDIDTLEDWEMAELKYKIMQQTC